MQTINNRCVIVYKVDEDKGVYYAVADFREEYDDNHRLTWYIETTKELVEGLSKFGVSIKHNNPVPGFDFDFGYGQRHVRMPFFVTMRTFDRRRQDIDDLLSAIGMEFYDQFEVLIRTRGKTVDDWGVIRELNGYNVINRKEFSEFLDNINTKVR